MVADTDLLIGHRVEPICFCFCCIHYLNCSSTLLFLLNLTLTAPSLNFHCFVFISLGMHILTRLMHICLFPGDLALRG